MSEKSYGVWLNQRACKGRRAPATNLEPQEVFLAIRPRHFNELVNAANAGDVVGDEGLELGVQLYIVGLVAAMHAGTHVQALSWGLLLQCTQACTRCEVKGTPVKLSWRLCCALGRREWVLKCACVRNARGHTFYALQRKCTLRQGAAQLLRGTHNVGRLLARRNGHGQHGHGQHKSGATLAGWRQPTVIYPLGENGEEAPYAEVSYLLNAWQSLAPC